MKLRETGVPPTELFRQALPQQTKLVRALLDSDPEKRPSVADLLTSDEYLPARIEDDYLHDIIRQLTIPGNRLRERVLGALFTKVHSTLTMRDPVWVGFDSKAEALSFGADSALHSLDSLKESVRSVFVAVAARHGARSVSTPVLISPNTNPLSVLIGTKLDDMSKCRTLSCTYVLTEQGEQLMVRRDFRSRLAERLAGGLAGVTKCYQVGDVWGATTSRRFY